MNTIQASNSMLVGSWKAEEFGHSRVQHVDISPQVFSNQALRNPRTPMMTTKRNYRVIMHYKNFFIVERVAFLNAKACGSQRRRNHLAFGYLRARRRNQVGKMSLSVYHKQLKAASGVSDM
jgi:hypothetical protein